MPEIALLISYVPMLDYFTYKRGVPLGMEPLKWLEEFWPTTFQPHFNGCLWTGDDSDGEVKHTPVLLTENAKPLVDHLVEWSEFAPEDWFKLLVYDDGVRYTVTLVPNIDESIKRWELAYWIEHSKKSESEYRVIYRPLQFGSGVGAVYHSAKKSLSGKVGFLDLSEFSMDRPFDIDASKIMTLGPFPFADPADYADTLKNYLDELEEAEMKSVVNPDATDLLNT